MEITELLTNRTGEESQIERFEKLYSKCRSKKDVRELEMHLLKPKPVPKYIGPKSGKTAFQKNSLLLLFPDSKYIERLGKFVRISTYVENNTYDTKLFTELVSLLEKGKIKWSNHKKKFFLISKTGKRIRI